jgi:hypothetical protein
VAVKLHYYSVSRERKLMHSYEVAPPPVANYFLKWFHGNRNGLTTEQKYCAGVIISLALESPDLRP